MATNGLKVVKNSILELRLVLRKIKILLYIFLATKQNFQFHKKKKKKNPNLTTNQIFDVNPKI